MMTLLLRRVSVGLLPYSTEDVPQVIIQDVDPACNYAHTTQVETTSYTLRQKW